MEKEKNNLFSYATSELSQDAFICWLLNWANPIYQETEKALHDCGIELLDAFFDKCKNGKHPEKYSEVKVEKQFENIDVLVIVNNKYVIIIEDKTDTKNHSGQLKRYKEIVLESKREELPEKFSDDNLLSIYFKTGNQSNLQDVESKDYKPFMRGDFLKILDDNSKKIDNAIFKDYYDFLENIDNKTKNYKEKNIGDWKWYEWQGFYIELQGKLNLPKGKEKDKWESEWDYVANPSGGFQGFWWYWHKINGDEIYLQLEEAKLCFKIMIENKSKRSELRNLWHSKIMETCKEKNIINVSKPDRFGNGKFMTIAVLKDYRYAKDDGKIDMEKTIKQLNEMENILEDTFINFSFTNK